MNSTTTQRRHRSRDARFALGAFLMVWLNIVLQPCTMASMTDTADVCPNCPTQMMEHPGEVLHDDCDYGDSCMSEGRIDLAKVNDVPQNSLPIASEPPVVTVVNLSVEQIVFGNLLAIDAAGRPLNILYGVYLI